MTENEAIKLHIAENLRRIKVIEEFLRTNSDADDKECRKNIQILTKTNDVLRALQELKQYRAIGTVEECREAREKQRGKKPTLYGDFDDGKLICPNCEEDLMDLAECGFNCCPYCGQAIDWSELGTVERKE